MIAERASNPNTKLVFDKSLSEWTARYRKNKKCLDSVCFQCDHLRLEVTKAQDEVDKREEEIRHIDDKLHNEVYVRASNAKKSFEQAKAEQLHLNNKITEQRRIKQKLSKDLNSLRGDYDRKYAELNRTVEQHTKLEGQLDSLTKRLGAISNERRKMEQELGVINQCLLEGSGVLQDISTEVSNVRAGIRNSVDHHMAAPLRFENSRMGLMNEDCMRYSQHDQAQALAEFSPPERVQGDNLSAPVS